MVLMTVLVPDGLFAGDVMMVESGGGNYEILVPPGCKGGMPIEIDLPGGEDEPPPADEAGGGTVPVEITVPDGVEMGQSFSVDFGGTIYDIVCPDGCFPGSAIVVELPASSADDDRGAPPPQPPPPEPPPPPEEEPAEQPSHFKFHPGQRVELYRSDGAESPGYIVCGFEGVFDVCYKVKL